MMINYYKTDDKLFQEIKIRFNKNDNKLIKHDDKIYYKAGKYDWFFLLITSFNRSLQLTSTINCFHLPCIFKNGIHQITEKTNY
jgi:hypothetical protein